MVQKILNILLSLIFWISLNTWSQSNDGFQFHRENKRSYKIKFVNFNNLIIIKAKLNGQPMNLLLDTGVAKTVLFGLNDETGKIKEQSDKILIKGVSGKLSTYAYKTENNILEIGKLKDKSHDVYAIFDKEFNISDKIGYQLQGILGHDFFKDLVVKINYVRNYIKVYNPEYFKRALRSYDKLELRLHKEKPYIKTPIKLIDTWQDYVFLLDTGSGGAIWVKPQADTTIPKENFRDILGYGFADIIRGTRAKAKSLQMGDYTLPTPKTAYPDTVSYKGVGFAQKSGLIGSEVMRRFHWIFDYKNSMVYFKTNRYISDVFNYDMSGLIFKYEGFQSNTIYQNIFPQAVSGNENANASQKIQRKTKIFLELHPILKVGAVRHNSSAYEAGFVEGDIILEINGRPSYKYDLEDITKIMSSEEGREIKFIIERGNREYEKTLILKSRFSE